MERLIHSFRQKKKLTEKQSFADVLENSYLQKFRKIYRKAPVPESLF